MQILTGKGSAPSWITKPSIRWVRMWDLTRAWAGLLSTLRWLLLLFPFPEVMTGAVVAPHLSTQAAGQTQQVWTTWTWTWESPSLPLSLQPSRQLLCKFTKPARLRSIAHCSCSMFWRKPAVLSICPTGVIFDTDTLHQGRFCFSVMFLEIPLQQLTAYREIHS